MHLVNRKGASSFQQCHCTTEQQESACKRLRPCQRGWGAKQPVKAARVDVHMRKGQDRSERKGNRASQRKTHNCSWWGQDEWVWHLQHSQIEGACHASWMVWGWLSLRSLGPATNLSYPVLNHSWMQNVRNVNDAPTGELETRSWQGQVKNKKVNNRWKEGGQSKQKSTNRSSSFVNDVYS